MVDTDRALAANSVKIWDRLWSQEKEEAWRKEALKGVYERIVKLVPNDVVVIDIGGGIGTLAEQIRDEKDCYITVCDHSPTALQKAADDRSLDTYQIDLEATVPEFDAQLVVSTELLEHLTEEARERLLSWMAKQEYGALISVPDDRLGPEEEPQHTIKYTAVSLKAALSRHFEYVRVEGMGPYLLAVCGPLAQKDFKLSVTLPVRDEGHDLARTLSSFRGVADQLVVGVDPRTVDNTWEVAEKYADKVFYINTPQGPPEEYQGDDGIHFSWCRNQCIDQCDHEWIFMTEGHERLHEGVDILLNLDKIIPKPARIGLVAREGNGQRWGFPWLFQNSSDIKFTRPVHNTLDFPEKAYVVYLPQVITRHDRVGKRGVQRAEQRKVQNRTTLFDDWLSRESEHSLFYLAQEWREYDPKRSIERFEQFLQTSNQGGMRYQARLILSKEYMYMGDLGKARETLIPATGDDWSRTEHWIWLGDIAFDLKKFEEAYSFYLYATTKIGQPPFTLWWIDLSNYSYLPAQRMAMVCAELGILEEACVWAEKVVELLPEDAPTPLAEEAKANVDLLTEAINGKHS
jgi:glycosyltransferase involved in cell wall biosynthesis